MEYLNVFVIGELMRRGVSGAPEPRVGVQAFLVVVAAIQYVFLAPLYWFWMWRRACGSPISQDHPAWDPRQAGESDA